MTRFTVSTDPDGKSYLFGKNDPEPHEGFLSGGTELFGWEPEAVDALRSALAAAVELGALRAIIASPAPTGERPDTAWLRDGAAVLISSMPNVAAEIKRAADWIDAQPPASPVPPTPTPCPYIVTGGEGTSHCSLAERSAMHAAAPPSTPADPRPTDPTGSEA